MAAAQGVLTARGGATSHAAVVARQIGKPCVAGCASAGHRLRHEVAPRVDGLGFSEGEWISLDGTTGEVFIGALPTIAARLRGPGRAPEDARAGPTSRAGSRSGPTPTSPRRPRRPAATARRASACAAPSTCSARGSGWTSCVTRSSSHSRRRAPRTARRRRDADADDATAVARFDAAMAKLEALQQGDFDGILEAMDGLPVVIRLIDPPLHEFLPNHEELLRRGRRDAARRGEPNAPSSTRSASCCARSRRCASRTRCSACAASASGSCSPTSSRCRSRAILEAPRSPQEDGGDPHAEIMIPLVGHVNELTRDARAARGRVAEGRRGSAGIEVDYKFGTMIEMPRGGADGRRDRRAAPSSSASAPTT